MTSSPSAPADESRGSLSSSPGRSHPVPGQQPQSIPERAGQLPYRPASHARERAFSLTKRLRSRKAGGLSSRSNGAGRGQRRGESGAVELPVFFERPPGQREVETPGQFFGGGGEVGVLHAAGGAELRREQRGCGGHSWSGGHPKRTGREACSRRRPGFVTGCGASGLSRV